MDGSSPGSPIVLSKELNLPISASLSYLARDLTVRRSFESDALSSPILGSLGQMDGLFRQALFKTLPSGLLTNQILKKMTSPLANLVSSLKPKIYRTQRQRVLWRVFFRTASANFDTMPSASWEREREREKERESARAAWVQYTWPRRSFIIPVSLARKACVRTPFLGQKAELHAARQRKGCACR